MGKRLGNLLGEFVAIDTSKKGDCTGSVLRVRVGLEVSKPLRRNIMLDIGLVEASKLQLEYEDLPHFCLFCGRLSHFSTGCPLAKEGVITEPQFGRRGTLCRNVFSIEPDGKLGGITRGPTEENMQTSTTTHPVPTGPIITQEVDDRSTKKNSGWRMTAPEPSLIGHVRSRDEKELVEPHTVEDMVVDQPAIPTVADLTNLQNGGASFSMLLRVGEVHLWPRIIL